MLSAGDLMESPGPAVTLNETALLPLPGPEAGICGPVCYDHFLNGTQQS